MVDRALVAARLRSQLLSGPRARTPAAVVERLLAVQAQDARGARLAIRARSTGVTAADVDAALGRRELVIAWLNRGTLHLVTASDYWWLHALTTPRLVTGNERRLRQEGVSPAQAARGVDVVMAAVAEQPRTREQLREVLEAEKVPTARQALVHILASASFHRDLVRGPMVDGDQAFVSASQWLGPPPPPLDRAEALARLTRRYLAGHAPATAADLAKWAGITLGDARNGFAALAGELPDRRPARPVAIPPPRLLGPFDPLLLGWASREFVTGSHTGIATTNGIIRPVALVGGQAVATWGLAGGTVTIRPWQRIPKAAVDALTADAADVLRFLGRSERPAVIVER